MIGRFGVWLAGVAVLACVLVALALTGHLQIHSNLLALLPTSQRNPVETAAVERIGEMGQRRLIMLIGADDAGLNKRAADVAAKVLLASGAFSQVLQSTDDLLDSKQHKTVQHLISAHRFHLLAPADRAALVRLASPPASDDAAARRHFIGRAEARLYGFGMGGDQARFIADPLGLSAAYRSARVAGLTVPGLHMGRDGHFYVQGKQDRRFAVIFARSKADPFTPDAQAAQLGAISKARAEIRAVAANATVLVSGVLPHAAAATDRARSEVLIIGVGSMAGILLLMLWIFGSIRPFLLSYTAMVGGGLLALLATNLLFGVINILTIVFGISIVCVAVDYCMLFFAQRWDTPSSREAILRILPAISLGLLANVLAYGSMAIANFPGLRQMGVFAAFGLVGAWLGVILLLPAWAGPAPRRGSALRLAQFWLDRGLARVAAWRGGLLLGMAGLLVVLPILVAVLLVPQDNIGLLYNAPPKLKHVDRQVAQLLGTRSAGQIIAVHGSSRAAVLQAEADLVQALGGPAPVASVSAITESFPPVAQQRRDYERLAQTLYAPDGPVQQLLTRVGYSHKRIVAQQDAFAAQRGRVLSFPQWLDSPLSAGMRQLWLGQIGNEWATLIRVLHVYDGKKLDAVIAHHPQATFIDRGARISSLLGHYRYLATWLLGAAYVLAWAVLSWALGVRGALTVVFPPMLASIIVAFLYAITGWPFSLFNVMAMILLLGLGADYGIFLHMTGKHRASAMLAVGASAGINLLGFGLLALSATPALHSFGLTLALGLGLTFMLASLLGGRAPNRNVAA